MLVSICIPTYNRLSDLHRSVQSALGQTHQPVEVLVADNASTDGTAEWLHLQAGGDPRLRVLTSDVNLGPTENFNRVRGAARGAFVMWLGDDDWLDEGYVEVCVARLRDDPRAAHASGRVRYHPVDGVPWEVIPAAVLDPDPTARVLAYYRGVRDNGAFYGLSRASALDGVPAMGAVMGNDWFHVADLAWRGPLMVDPSVAVHRAVGGATRSLAHVARVGGYPRWQGVVPQVAIIVGAVRHLARPGSAGADASSVVRARLGVSVGGVLSRRLLPEAAGKWVRRVRASRRIHRPPGSRR